jgi:hypothetical protein
VKEQEAQKKLFTIKRVVCIGGGILLVLVVMALLVSGSGRTGGGARVATGAPATRSPRLGLGPPARMRMRVVQARPRASRSSAAPCKAGS